MISDEINTTSRRTGHLWEDKQRRKLHIHYMNIISLGIDIASNML